MAKKKTQKTKKWVITTSNERPIDEVTQELTKSGFTVEQVLETIGSVTGAASDDVAEKLRKVPGVADVSPDADVNIGPPNGDVTW